MAVAVKIGCARRVDQPVARLLVSLVPQSIGVGRRWSIARWIEPPGRRGGGPNLIGAPKSFLHVSSIAPETLETRSLRRVTFGRTSAFGLLLIHYELYTRLREQLNP
jgi:hypothetical protein